MKRYNNIFEKIINIDNIMKAINRASKGKRGRKEVERILDSPLFYAMEIRKMLVNKLYVPNKSKEAIIIDGISRKVRVIHKPKFFPDQIIHWSIMLILEEYFMKGMYHYSCASIKGRGVYYGAKYLKKILKCDRKNTKYCLKLDIKKYYPSIDKEILKSKFKRIFKDKDLLELLNLIVDSCENIPIGFYTSQWFANFYLTDLDHYIKEKLKIKYYIRYADDMVLFSNNKKNLHKTRILIEDYLKREKLKLKENYSLFKVDNRFIDFLGYKFYRGYIKLRRGIFLKIKRKVKRIYKKKYINIHNAYSMISYNGWIIHSNYYNYYNKYIKPYVDIEVCKKIISLYDKSNKNNI